MRVKNKRILKNGAIAGYVYYKDEKKWKWRIIGRKKMKGGFKKGNSVKNKKNGKIYRIIAVFSNELITKPINAKERNRETITFKSNELKNLELVPQQATEAEAEPEPVAQVVNGNNGRGNVLNQAAPQQQQAQNCENYQQYLNMVEQRRNLYCNKYKHGNKRKCANKFFYNYNVRMNPDRGINTHNELFDISYNPECPYKSHNFLNFPYCCKQSTHFFRGPSKWEQNDGYYTLQGIYKEDITRKKYNNNEYIFQCVLKMIQDCEEIINKDNDYKNFYIHIIKHNPEILHCWVTTSQEIDDKWLTPSQGKRVFNIVYEIPFNQQNNNNIIKNIHSPLITAYTIYGVMEDGELLIFFLFFTG